MCSSTFDALCVLRCYVAPGQEGLWLTSFYRTLDYITFPFVDRTSYGGFTLFDQLFPYPRVAARHQNGPWADARLRYLHYLSAQGAAPLTLRHNARELLIIARQMSWDGSTKIHAEQIAAAADCWAARPQSLVRQGRRTQKAEGAQAFFIRVAHRWFRFLGCLDESENPIDPVHALVADFAAHLREERGLSPRTIQSRCWHVERLLGWLVIRGQPLPQLSLEQIDEYLSQMGNAGWNRVSINTGAGAIRSFVRYAEKRGWCSPGMSAAIHGPRLYRDEGLPAGPNWPTVRLLLAGVESNRPTDVRDRAILLLFAAYGFRSGEVAQLRLEDLDWEREQISVTRSKSHRTQTYRLTAGVGEAILRYLQEVRPRCQRRELFLARNAPWRPLSQGALWHVVADRLRQLPGTSAHWGPHSLRHACATRLVEQGVTFPEISDHLGHHSVNSTRLYAKVDLASLREVGRLDWGGIL
jgi:integrase/recombinase XerD